MLNIVSSSIDTFEITCKTKISHDSFKLLGDAKGAAALNKYRSTEIDLMGKKFMVLSHGAGIFQYLLNGRDMDFKICQTNKISLISARIRSIAIYEFGIEKMLEEVMDVITTLRDSPGFVPTTVKRIDVCVDFQGWIPKLTDFKRFACKAKKRGMYLEPDEPNYMSFGRGAMMVRLYDKTEELQHSHKEWLYPVWQQCADYNEDQPVWRLEVQLRREMLKSLAIDSPEEALKQLRGIWQFGLEWLELKKPTRNKQKTRWPTDPRWLHLKEKASFEGAPCNRVRPIKRAKDEERIIRMFGAYLSSFAAIRGYKDMDLSEVVFRAGVLYHNQLEAKGLDFSTVVKSKISPDSGFPF